MNQKFLTAEDNANDKPKYPEVFNKRFENYNGFLYQTRPEKMLDQTDEDRNKMFDDLWKMVCTLT